MLTDKQVEKMRYDNRASLGNRKLDGVVSVPFYLRGAYEEYEDVISNEICSEDLVLELGCGTGEWTGILLESGAHVVAADISIKSLGLLRSRNQSNRLHVQSADMEFLPFRSSCFDAVVCAGSLSYGDHYKVSEEIKRVLKDRGRVIFVDVLNDNIIYRGNRFVHFLLGRRSWSVIRRAPSIHYFDVFWRDFDVVLKFYGGLVWLVPFMKWFLDEKQLKRFIDYTDRIFSVQRSAFRFVMFGMKNNEL